MSAGRTILDFEALKRFGIKLILFSVYTTTRMDDCKVVEVMIKNTIDKSRRKNFHVILKYFMCVKNA